MRRIFQRISGVRSGDETINLQEEVDVSDEEELEEEFEEAEEEAEDEEWLEEDYEEGQLSIDVFQTANDIIVKSTIAGVKPEDIDISMNNDMLTIRGKRSMEEEVKEEDYIYRECYWGSFSRSVIMPVEIDTQKIDASLENGVLTIVLPKAKSAKEISIKVKER